MLQHKQCRAVHRASLHLHCRWRSSLSLVVGHTTPAANSWQSRASPHTPPPLLCKLNLLSAIIYRRGVWSRCSPSWPRAMATCSTMQPLHCTAWLTVTTTLRPSCAMEACKPCSSVLCWSRSAQSQPFADKISAVPACIATWSKAVSGPACLAEFCAVLLTHQGFVGSLHAA